MYRRNNQNIAACFNINLLSTSYLVVDHAFGLVVSPEAAPEAAPSVWVPSFESPAQGGVEERPR